MEPIVSKLSRKFSSVIFKLFYARRFAHFGKGSTIQSPLHIYGEQRITIGDNVLVQYKSWLAATDQTGENDSRLAIGDGCVIGHFNELYATKSIVLEKNVLTADRVYISDNLHSYENPDMPVIAQPIKQISPVRIGEGSWIGIGAVVLGANIGMHCVIGANSVVTRDIPDYCVAAGAPARVIKRYDPEKKQWVSVKEPAVNTEG